ncbi:hypothetical protein [Paracnuella aquatica]|uniref:hypothetical protein n=1 Tax=Paracnuella aquatica TaxID=2268757 RepID=UPI000DEF7176|nr:hypothetical protein [Paracnuella aquatica]RPD50624.1 hypothetical protein DRJ53_06780 [Paracnuella aquatica]
MLAAFKKEQTYWLLLLPLVGMACMVHIGFWLKPAASLLQEDIYYIWLEGNRIINGENPYARILASDMNFNNKYATYFPVTYLLSALVQKLGLTTFADWIYFWRPVSLIFNIGIATLVLKFFRDRSLTLLGFAAAMTLILGRWSIYIVRVHHIEFPAIFFLLLSLVLLNRQRTLSLLALSLSLGIKQVAIFLLPLYLIYLWQTGDKNNRFKNMFLELLLIGSIPLLTSLPFIVADAESFIKSILFSATRFGDAHIIAAPSFDVVLAKKFTWFSGLIAKAPMLLLMGIIYLSYLKEKAGMWVCCTMVMMTFVYFNSILFLQYIIWPVCLIPFALAAHMQKKLA